MTSIDSQPAAAPFAKKAATFSAVAPFVGMAINIFGRHAAPDNRTLVIVLGAASTLLVVAGFVCALVGLFGVRRHGPQGILGRALAGAFMNGLLIAVMLVTLSAMLKTGGQAPQPPPVEQRPPAG